VSLRPFFGEALVKERSRFAERFTQFVERSPMAYLAERRLPRALDLAASESTPIKTIAGKAGYRSAAPFTRAFTDRFGGSPRVRRRGA
jgi:transcriptional regulator GlxA family with amidase domain